MTPRAWAYIAEGTCPCGEPGFAVIEARAHLPNVFHAMGPSEPDLCRAHGLKDLREATEWARVHGLKVVLSDAHMELLNQKEKS
jgi:hypothetical protein